MMHHSRVQAIRAEDRVRHRRLIKLQFLKELLAFQQVQFRIFLNLVQVYKPVCCRCCLISPKLQGSHPYSAVRCGLMSSFIIQIIQFFMIILACTNMFSLNFALSLKTLVSCLTPVGLPVQKSWRSYFIV